jgi:L-iditol 2-dehydrogenase
MCGFDRAIASLCWAPDRSGYLLPRSRDFAAPVLLWSGWKTKQYGCEVIVGDASRWAQEVDGLGADGVVDATGVSVALNNALDLVRPAGWISKVGWGPQPIGFSLDRLVQKNITLQGSFSHNWPIWERMIRLIASGVLDVRPITGGVWPLSQWKEAFEAMHSGKIVKAVLKPEV